MAKSGIQIFGVKELMQKLKRMEADIGAEAEVAMKKIGVYGEGKVKLVLGPDGGARTGRIYSTGKKGARYKSHQVSAPGEPPAIWHGKLRASISYMTERGKDWAKAYIGPIGKDRDRDVDEYSKDLELGKPPYLRPRPYLFSTLQKEAKNMVEIVRKSLQQSLQKYRKK